jgi:hypothetical protein
MMPADNGAPEIRFSNFRLSLVCGDLLKFRLEGFWEGKIDLHHCDRRTVEQRLRMILYAHGKEGSGGLWDVYVDDEVDRYDLDAPWQMRFQREVGVIC